MPRPSALDPFLAADDLLNPLLSCADPRTFCRSRFTSPNNHRFRFYDLAIATVQQFTDYIPETSPGIARQQTQPVSLVTIPAQLLLYCSVPKQYQCP